MNWFKRTLAGLAIAGFSFLASVSPALAIAVPTTNPTISWVYAYENYIELTDQIYFVRWNWPYTTGTFPTGYPTETGQNGILVRLLTGAGVELGATSPVVYFQNGWGEQIAAIYFSAAQVTALGMSWSGAYSISVEGNPLLTWTGGARPTAVNSTIQYQAAPSTVAVTDALLTTQLPAWALNLEQTWNATLTSSSEGVIYLNEYGDAYFNGLMPSLHAQLPNIFGSSLSHMTATSAAKGTTYADNLRAGIAGTIFDLTPAASMIGLPMTLLLSVIYSGLCAWVIYKICRWMGTTKYMTILAIPLIIGGGVLGVLAMIVPILAGLFGGLSFIYSMWFEQGSV